MSVIHGVFSPGAQVTRTETALVRTSEGPVFTLPVCLLVTERERAREGPECYGMTVSGTHPAFPSAPAVRAKAEKGEMADI